MSRVYTRRFDWDEALRRYESGETVRDLAKEYGVSKASIYNATHPEAYRRTLAYNHEWTRSGVCEECGGRMTKNKRYRRCHACAMRARRTSVRDDELLCFYCHEWKPDAEFPRNNYSEHRRRRHSYCRACQTIAKRDYRERKREAI